MTYVDRLLSSNNGAAAAQINGQTRSPAAAGCPELGPLLSILMAMIGDSRSMVVNIASAYAGAGTSTVARKLAEAAASTGWCRVALIDARPGGMQPGGGLVDAIERGDTPQLTPRRIGAYEVDYGQLSGSGGSLPRIDSVRRLYGGLRDRYSLVLVDCPAVFAGQQTLVVAAAADDTVLVVEAERTALADVARARAALEQRGAGVLGLVMSKSRSRVPARFGGSA